MALNRWIPQTISGKALAIILPAAILLFSVMTWAAYEGARQRAISSTIELLNDDTALAKQQLAQRFDAIATAEKHASELMITSLSRENNNAGRFNAMFPEKGDGTRRSIDRLWTGQQGSLAPKGYGAFIGAVDASPDRQSKMLAAFDTLRVMAEGLPEEVDNLYFFSPDNDLLMFAPNRADKLTYYRKDAPADLDFQSEEFSLISNPKANPDSVMRCTSLQPILSDTKGTTWTTGCMTPVRRGEQHLGAWGSSISLDAIVGTKPGSSARAISQIIVTSDGQLIRHPKYTVQSSASTEQFLDLKNVDDVSLQALWQLLQSANNENESAYVSQGDQYYAYTRLQQPSWYVVSSFSGDQVRRDAFLAARPVLIGGAIGTAAFALFLIIFFRRQIAAPLTRLADRADSISTYAAVDGTNTGEAAESEITRLDRAFDAMETRVARERLRMSQSFDTMVDAIDDYAIILLDSNGKIRRANRAAADNFLWDERKEGGLQQIFNPSENPSDALHLHLQTVQNQSRVLQSVSRFRGDGRRFWAEEITQIIAGENGQTDGFAYIVRDNSEAKAAETKLIEAHDQARAAAEMRMNLLATVSHEIRTPMTGILGMLDQARNDDSARTKAKSFDLIEGASHAMMRVLDDVLQQARLESGKIQIDRRVFSAGELIQQTAELFTPLAKRNDTQIRTNTLIRSKLIGDPARIQQVLANFTSNAIKFAEKGTISIACEERSNGDDTAQVEFTVADNGLGIAPEALGRLFERFEQASPTTQMEYGGSGLGLSICRDLAHAMGGEVSAESTPGVGSTFKLTLTLGVEPADVVEQPGIGQSALALIPAATSRISVEAALEELGFDTVSVAALAGLGDAHRVFDLIVFDDAYFRPSQIIARFMDMPAIALSELENQTQGRISETDMLRSLVNGMRNVR